MREKDKEWLEMMANENNSMGNYGDVSHNVLEEMEILERSL